MESQSIQGLIEAVVSNFFAPKKPKEKEQQPGDKEAKADSGVSTVAELAGASVGMFLGGTTGAQIGAKAGAFVADQGAKAMAVPQGPGATITSGSVDVSGAEKQLQPVADHLQQLAVRGIQTKLVPSGQNKVY